MREMTLVVALVVGLVCELADAADTDSPGATGRAFVGDARSVIFPADAGVVDVTHTPYGAKGDGSTDDTAALQKALAETHTIYLPAGTYLVSDTLAWQGKRTILQGESRDKTIIKLKDNCPGFADPKQPKRVISAEWGHGGQAFRNSVYDLTVDVGSGNAGAIGIGFHQNNQGAMENISVRSSDPQSRGAIGLALTKPWPGPGLVKNLTVEGFNYGILIENHQYSMTFEHVVLRGQRVAGIENRQNVIAVRGLRSENHVPAIRNSEAAGMVVLIDAELTGGSDDACAIENADGAALFARNVRAGGYAATIRSESDGKPSQVRGFVEEFVSSDVLSLFPSGKHSLGLPIKETPELPWDSLDDWISPRAFGGAPDDGQDDTAAIQQAIDSGKSTVYLPRGQWIINDTIRVRGNARRIVGMESSILTGPGFENTEKPAFRIEDGTSNVVGMERYWIAYNGRAKMWCEHASARTLVAKNCWFGPYVGTGHGELFLEDVVGGPWVFNGQKVWARQLNPEEGDAPNVTNQGGDLWILLLKTEKYRPGIVTTGGGRTEMLGGFLYPSRGPRQWPAFVNDNSTVSLTYVNQAGVFPEQVVETRDGQTRVLRYDQVPRRAAGGTTQPSPDKAIGGAGGVFVPLYVGEAQATPTVAPAR